MSTFAISGKAKEEGDPDDLPFDEAKMEKAMQMLAKEAGNMNEDDPKKTADLLRKLSQISGMELGDSMHEALKRIENGEDPEKIEAEMGNILDHEDPFLFSRKTKGGVNKKAPPRKDDTLYDL